MSFLHPVWLWLLPLAFLPLILSLVQRLNPVREEFPSNQILKKILHRQSLIHRNGLMIHEILKVLLLVLLVLAAAVPFLKSNVSRVVVVDPTLSMTRFAVKKELKKRLGNQECRFYLGSSPVKWSDNWDFTRFYAQHFNASAVLQSILQRYTHSKILFVTDGQKQHFHKALNVSTNRIEMLVLTTNLTNATLMDFQIEPHAVIVGESFNLSVHVRNANGLPLKIQINGRPLFSRIIRHSVEHFDFSLDEAGIYRFDAQILGDEWKADNIRTAFAVVVLRPSVATSHGLAMFHKMLESVLVSPLPRASVENANIRIIGSDDAPGVLQINSLHNDVQDGLNEQISLNLIVSEESGSFTRLMHSVTGVFPQYAPQVIVGQPKSVFPVLNHFKEVKWSVLYRKMPGEVLLSIRGVPVLTKFRGMFWLNVDFSRFRWKQNVLAYLLLHEWFRSSVWQERVMSENDFEGQDFLNVDGEMMNPDMNVGRRVYRESEKGRFLVHNVPLQESGDCYSADWLLKWSGGTLYKEDGKTRNKPYFFNRTLIVLMFILLLLEAWVRKWFSFPSHL